MITQANRFHGHGSLRYVYKKGKTIRSSFVTVKYTPNPFRRQSRIAVVVSKKVLKSAVGRNRIRRRIYEIIRKVLPNLGGVYDIAIIVNSSEIKDTPSPCLHEHIMSQLEEAELLSSDKL